MDLGCRVWDSRCICDEPPCGPGPSRFGFVLDCGVRPKVRGARGGGLNVLV